MMKKTSVGQVVFAVGRAAESLYESALKHAGTASITADQLRLHVRTVLDAEGTWNAREFWHPLEDEEKEEALKRAIPDGTYPEFWEVNDPAAN